MAMTVEEYASELCTTPEDAFLTMVKDSEYYVDGETEIVDKPEYDMDTQLWRVMIKDGDGETYLACVDDQLDPGNVFIF